MACVHSCILLLALGVAVALSLDIASAKPAERTLGLRSTATRGAYPLRRRFSARGCSSFGHSCFGGHGKRSDEDFPPADYQQGEQELPETPQLPSTYRQTDIVPLLRQWLQLQSYRRMAEGTAN